MRITNLRLEDLPGGRGAAAQVIWEQAKRPAETLFFDVGGPWADRLQLRREAFVLACLPSAFWCDERRLMIDAALCPRLGQGLRQLIQLWEAQYSRRAGLLIEPQDGWQVPDRAAMEFTAAFFSGGVDALSTLLSNRSDYSVTHAGAIQACLFLYGTNAMQMGPDGPDHERLNFYRFHQKRLQVLAETEYFVLLPIITNVRRFSPSYAAWSGAGYVPGTLAAAHLFTGSITRVLFAANGMKINSDAEAIAVHLCSSAGLDAWIDQPGVSRMQKLELLGRWPAWLDLIQPCHLVKIPGGESLNCGHCEKCVCTKLALSSLGLAIRPCMFASPQVQSLRLLRCPMVSHKKVSLFQDLVRLLWRADRRGIALLLWLRILVARLRLVVSPARW